MKQLTEKQILSLEDQIAKISFRLEKVCQNFKIGERMDQLSNERWYDYDAENQEGMVNALHQADHALSNVHHLLTILKEQQGA
jgi:polyphosphate kinase 2 (PPK2 family)